MEKRWVYKDQGDEKIVRQLAEELSIDLNLSNLLVQRGTHTFDQARSYFRPQLDDLHDPFIMKDMDLAIDRIHKAIKGSEKILVYGDYDVDGTTAVALVYTFLKRFYANVDFYIPDRDTEGYGISYQGIDFASENGYSLMIILDCGIKAIEKTIYAIELNLDFIICDHHRPGDEIPPACAVLDAKRSDCPYPFKELSGCGVGFKLAQAYALKHNIPQEDLLPLLDLVVVSIAADIVPINGENRILAHYGLELINKGPRKGIEAILLVGNVKRTNQVENDYIFNKELTISDLVFMVGPRINAAGRIESAKNSVRLLVEEDQKEAMEIARKINLLNDERKSLDLHATTDALRIIRESQELREANFTVVYNPEWHKGVIGIVASRLTETYYRPTIVLTYSNGLITGSARSVKDFDIYDAVDACSHFLEHFGGHKYAAGLSLKEENLENFRNCFKDYVDAHITKELLVPEVEIDSEIILRDINSRFFRILRQFAPFGPGNLSPLFTTNGLVDTGKARVVGKNHLKLEVVHPDISGFPFSAIAFQQGHHYENIREGKQFSACYHIEENEWNGVKSIQLNIKDMKFEE
ncbi:MAG: single-stranded-DNA-specific exonuclease RecJ [Bacteroidetes bacterium]|nr:MAG: single-stranded-DNA-specific exonuclease RecJ [Bacteroidota bacterium]